MTTLDPLQESARAQFDRQSARYGKGHILAQVDDVDAALAQVPPAGPAATALDVATGAGHTAMRLAEKGYAVIAADLAAGMLEQTRLGAAEKGLKLETRQHAAEALPYPDGSFDVVTCRVAAHHFSHPDAFVRETARVLKPGGHFILIDGSIYDDVPVVEEWLHQVEKLRDPSHGRFLTPKGWRSLCAAAGLEVLGAELHPLKQPDLNWYFETAATPPANRAAVLEKIATAPAEVITRLKLAEEEGKTVWWWPRLTLVARKPLP
jgi:ubiquinone/menaquinone biosynthesis C-methylase UbiE